MAAGDSLLYLRPTLDTIERSRDWTWRKVAGIRNVLRHEYHDVVDTEVWRIVVGDLGKLPETDKALMQKA